MPYDLSHLGFLAGQIGRLITISFFFFQAEDGIRDATVTGVQTCALPISRHNSSNKGRRLSEHAGSCGSGISLPSRAMLGSSAPAPPLVPAAPTGPVALRAARVRHRLGRPARSEERRVGKECR